MQNVVIFYIAEEEDDRSVQEATDDIFAHGDVAKTPKIGGLSGRLAARRGTLPVAARTRHRRA